MKKKLKINDFEVVFDSNGDLIQRPHYMHPTYKTEKNRIFSDTLKYDGYLSARKGGNSHICFVSLNTGRKYSMFMDHFDDALRAERFINNLIAGDFYFVKKGHTQGIRLLIDDAP